MYYLLVENWHHIFNCTDQILRLVLYQKPVISGCFWDTFINKIVYISVSKLAIISANPLSRVFRSEFIKYMKRI